MRARVINFIGFEIARELLLLHANNWTLLRQTNRKAKCPLKTFMGGDLFTLTFFVQEYFPKQVNKWVDV